MNPIALFQQLRAGPQSPGALLGALSALMSDPGRVRLAALAELAQGADLVGPRPLPAALSRLMQDTGARYGIPAELLAAIAVTLTGVDPDYQDGGRVGLMALPLPAIRRSDLVAAEVRFIPRPEEVRCTYSELLDVLPAAVAAVALNVETAAAELARLRSELPSRMAGAVFRYCELGLAHLSPDDRFARARVDAGRVVGAAVMFGLRALDGEFVAAAAAAFGAPQGGGDV